MKKVHVDEIETLPLPWLGLAWKPVRHTLGISAFGINAYHGEKEGDLVVEEHADRHQELYVVVRGRARFRSGEEEFDAPVGTFVLFEPDEHRVAHAAEPGTTVVAVGAEAERFEPSAWEFAFRAGALRELGRDDEAGNVVEEGLSRYPDRADLVYTRACLRAAAGDDDAALEDLRRAIELHPEIRDWAAEEPALEPIRDRI
jgi:tetratricopeptide (TPR) repeat protein